MKVEFYKSLWGMDGSLEAQLAKIKSAGYDGFEDWIKPHFEIRPKYEAAGLKYLAMVRGDTPDQFRADLAEAYDAGAVAATVHCGASNWTFEQGLDFFRQAMPIIKEVPFPVNFETHRGRLLYEPMSTARYLNEFPDLYLVADLSHWTVVTESMLGSFGPQLDLAIGRTRHIHARVGHEEGPQAPDPRVDQWKEHTEAFDRIWDRIYAARKSAGAQVFTVDPEFGPPNYMWTNPQGGAPASDLWDVCLWMTNRLRERWKE